MSISSEVLVESRTMRSQYTDRFEVLDKAGSLSLLPDDTHATTEMVADFYEVPVDTLYKVIRRNSEELESNGLRVLTGQEYKDFAVDNLSSANPRARRVTLLPRKAILNVGMLLTESDVARKVRAYLLSAEEMLTDEIVRLRRQAEALEDQLRDLTGQLDIEQHNHAAERSMRQAAYTRIAELEKERTPSRSQVERGSFAVCGLDGPAKEDDRC